MSGTITTSPAAAFSSAPLLDAEKVDVRRFCGYPTYGANPAGFNGWRFFQTYGLLEYRMNNLDPAEFQNVRYRLSLLYPIETAIAGAYATLNVEVAAAFTRNAREVGDREAHYANERRKLCQAVGIPPGPDLGDGAMRIVV